MLIPRRNPKRKEVMEMAGLYSAPTLVPYGSVTALTASVKCTPGTDEIGAHGHISEQFAAQHGDNVDTSCKSF